MPLVMSPGMLLPYKVVHINRAGLVAIPVIGVNIRRTIYKQRRSERPSGFDGVLYVGGLAVIVVLDVLHDHLDDGSRVLGADIKFVFRIAKIILNGLACFNGTGASTFFAQLSL